MSAPPSRDSIAGTGSSAPSNATARTGFGALYDYVTTLLGATGTAADARTALGAQAAGSYAASGANSDITSLAGVRTIQPISASVAAGAMTISASSLSLDFRSTTLGSGTVTNVLGTPSNLVISNGSTGGTVSGVQSRIYVIALNNAGTIELAWTNASGGVDLSETGLISTTAEGGAGAADSANVIYSTTARTNVAYRVIGYIESTQATAGTWATAPSTIQGYGGQALAALAAMPSLGYGQNWQTFTIGTQRVVGTTYYNTTGRTIFILIGQSGITSITFNINSSASWFSGSGTASIGSNITVPIPPGNSYNCTAGFPSVWSELR